MASTPHINPPAAFSQRLLAWFEQNGRHSLPWQGRNPYYVWLSEIMLQQTQVATVIPYFHHFIERFPTLATLAEAPTDHVLQYWSGLGYYARARNLHTTAQRIINQHQGLFPQDLDALMALPGIGRSTAAAILAQAFGLRHAILDGNVKRVLARHAGIAGVTSQRAVTEQLWTIAEYYTPYQRLADYTQALMDLGALCCTRRQPRCVQCPLASDCFAFTHQQTELLPTAKVRKTPPVRHQFFLMIQNPQGHILLEKRPNQGIWGGLWSLPQCDTATPIHSWILDQYGIQTCSHQTLAIRKHIFTHFQLMYTPQLVQMEPSVNHHITANQYWYAPEQTHQIGIAAPVAELLSDFFNVRFNDKLEEIKDE